MISLQRRTISPSSIKLNYHTPDACAVSVDGVTFQYQALSGEHWDELLRYMSRDSLAVREFLFDGTSAGDWDFTGDKSEWKPIFRLGWPGGSKLTITGAKAAVAALRKFYPLRDFQDGEDESQEPEATTAETVVPIQRVGGRPSAIEFRQMLKRTDTSRSPSTLD